ncbi:MAG TPA: YihA family ribosome biogenesis GTP-binding protein [Nitrospirae bacterium]|nr:YihA family ribosome biogenesis GTP-binding protein [Nitrospirota bacterium]
MKVTSAKFLLSVANPKQCPKLALPEIAFSGRSNVGKSSLINSLTGRKGLVKVSKTPGKTRLLNYFSINEKITFVDMPGYGFANVPLKVKASWGRLVETYLKESALLKAVVVLLDCRRTPNDDDRRLLKWLNSEEIPLILAFTKIDKIPKTKRHKLIKEALGAVAGLTGDNPKIIVYSSKTGEGKKELWAAIREFSE